MVRLRFELRPIWVLFFFLITTLFDPCSRHGDAPPRPCLIKALLPQHLGVLSADRLQLFSPLGWLSCRDLSRPGSYPFLGHPPSVTDVCDWCMWESGPLRPPWDYSEWTFCLQSSLWGHWGCPWDCISAHLSLTLPAFSSSFQRDSLINKLHAKLFVS